MFILLAGDLADGYEAYGPFPTRTSAEDYALTTGLSANTQTTIMGLMDSKQAGGTDPYVVLCGGVVHGWIPYGFFVDLEHAQDWADHSNRRHVIMKLFNPENPK